MAKNSREISIAKVLVFTGLVAFFYIFNVVQIWADPGTAEFTADVILDLTNLNTTTYIASGSKITAITTSGDTTTITVDTAFTAAVTATTTVTVTPVTRVFNTIVAGAQAMAEAVAEEPHIVIGNVTDKLMRFRPMGWYGVLGFAVYRDEALYRITSGSSIAAL